MNKKYNLRGIVETNEASVALSLDIMAANMEAAQDKYRRYAQRHYGTTEVDWVMCRLQRWRVNSVDGVLR